MATANDQMFDITVGQMLARRLASALDMNGDLHEVRDEFETMWAQGGGLGKLMSELMDHAVASTPLRNLDPLEVGAYYTATQMLLGLLTGVVDSQNFSAIVDELGEAGKSANANQAVIDKALDMLEDALEEQQRWERFSSP